MIASTRPPNLSRREKAAQVVMADFRFERPEYRRVEELVRAGIGGLCLFGGSIFEVAPLVNGLQRLARVPLLVASDFEDGAGQQISGATPLPTNMAVGASDSEELAELKGRVTGREARAMGVPWLFAPVVDLQSNPKNPIVNTRSFGEATDRVIRLARAFIRGARAAGALVCLKHFPGHGDVDVDSHLALPRLRRDARGLRERELKPFAALAAESDAVMTAHLLVEAIDGARPASLSRAITTDVLRGELGFGGIVCTDALIMGGVLESHGSAEAAVRALEAGADVALYPEDALETIDAIEAALGSGRLEEAALDRSIERLWQAKRKAGLAEGALVDVAAIEDVVGSAEHRAAAARIAEASIARAFDRAGLLPLSGPVRYAEMRDEALRVDTAPFRGLLQDRIQPEAPVGLLAVYSKYRAFSGQSGPDARLLREARASLGRVKELVVVSFGNPYAHSALPEASAYVCAFGDGEPTQRAAARALLGQIPFRGVLPVTL